LNDILGNSDAEEILLDPEKSLADSLAVAKGPASADWLPKIQNAKRAIKRLEIDQLKRFSPEQINALRELRRVIDERLSDWKQLTQKKQTRKKTTHVKARA
jgi:hypothetical protein